jgi:hypothetical protein
VQINALEEAFGADELDLPEAGLREEREEKENIRDMSDLGDVPDADRARLDEPEPAPVVAGSIIDLPFPAWMAEQQRADAYLGKIVSYLKPDGDSAMAEEWRKKHPKTEFRLVGGSGVRRSLSPSTGPSWSPALQSLQSSSCITAQARFTTTTVATKLLA